MGIKALQTVATIFFLCALVVAGAVILFLTNLFTKRQIKINNYSATNGALVIGSLFNYAAAVYAWVFDERTDLEPWICVFTGTLCLVLIAIRVFVNKRRNKCRDS